MTYVDTYQNLTQLEQQGIHLASWQIAENEIQGCDQDEIITRALADYLAESCHRWASFDEADADDTSYEQIIEEFKLSDDCQKAQAEARAAWELDEAIHYDIMKRGEHSPFFSGS